MYAEEIKKKEEREKQKVVQMKVFRDLSAEIKTEMAQFVTVYHEVVSSASYNGGVVKYTYKGRINSKMETFKKLCMDHGFIQR